ncbi:HD domain-containing protein [Geomonas sp. Red276]
MQNGGAFQITGLVYGLSSALDLVSQSLVNHHREVFSFAIKIADAFPISDHDKGQICIAALLHDIGVVAFHGAITPETNDAELNDHAELGHRLLRDFTPFSPAARMIRHHHKSALQLKEEEPEELIRLGAGIVHLADAIAQRLDAGHCLLNQCQQLRGWAAGNPSGVFIPEVVEAFLQQSNKEFFWFDAKFATVSQLGGESALSGASVALDLEGLKELSAVFGRIIDYRSRHTAAHSRSVAEVAGALAQKAGFSDGDCCRMQAAGNLHDLGKLALPVSILDKPGALAPEERNLVKSHPYHTYRILKEIPGLGDIPAWAALHHEVADGTGYPFHLKGDEIPLGARIVAVADNFAALSEHRPYRLGMERQPCLELLETSARAGKLDASLVALVAENYDELNELTHSALSKGQQEYQKILKESLYWPRITAGATRTGAHP